MKFNAGVSEMRVTSLALEALLNTNTAEECSSHTDSSFVRPSSRLRQRHHKWPVTTKARNVAGYDKDITGG
jgi:hypothetical protein